MLSRPPSRCGDGRPRQPDSAPEDEVVCLIEAYHSWTQRLLDDCRWSPRSGWAGAACEGRSPCHSMRTIAHVKVSIALKGSQLLSQSPEQLVAPLVRSHRGTHGSWQAEVMDQGALKGARVDSDSSLCYHGLARLVRNRLQDCGHQSRPLTAATDWVRRWVCPQGTAGELKPPSAVGRCRRVSHAPPEP